MRFLAVAVLISLALSPACTSKQSPPAGLEVALDFASFPAKYTCDGEDISPEVRVGEVEGARSLAVIVEDPDAPLGTFTHWLIWNVEPTRVIPEGVPRAGVVQEPIRAVQGKNDFGRIGYNGPCPPPGRPHRYVFKVYALDTELSLPPGSGRGELEKAMRGHIIRYGEAIATYQRGS